MFNDGRGRFRVSETGPAEFPAAPLGPANSARSRLCHRPAHENAELRDLYQRPREHGTRVLQYFRSKMKICHVGKHAFNIS